MTKVNRVFPAVPSGASALRDWTRYLSQLFFARSFTSALQGCTTQPQITIRYTVSAGIVCMLIPQVLATSSAPVAYLSGMPEEITPNHDHQCLARIVDNGITGIGLLQIGIDTGITLYKDLDEGTFNSFGIKGIKTTTLCYTLD